MYVSLLFCIAILIISICKIQSNPPLLVTKLIITDEEPFGKVARNTYLARSTFREYSNYSLMNCVTECMIRKHCKAFSYKREGFVCKLQKSPVDSRLQKRPGYVFSDIKTWPKFWLGDCEHTKQTCNKNEKCVVRNNETGCEISECPWPTLRNVTFKRGLRGINDTRNYTCDTGTQPTSHCDVNTNNSSCMTITCMENGTWSDAQMTCEVVSCGPSSNVSHATKMDNGTEYMDVVHYQCDTGYTGYTGGQHFVNRTCGANGTWSNGNLTCQIVSCGPSNNVSHATKMDNGTEYMDVVHYQCDTGYTGYTGGQHFVNRTCGANGTWSNGNLTCQIVSCGPSNNVSLATKMDNGTEYMDVVHYQCDTGYTGYTGYTGGQHSVNRTCGANGTWSNENLTCQIVSCGPSSNVSHATKMDNGTEYMDVVHYQCDTGYTGYTGGQHFVNRTCGANGTWSNGNLTCQIVSCGPSNNVSLATKMDNGTEYMDVVHYQCDTGYTGYTGGQHSVNRTCGANGTWSNENLTCQIVSCGPSSNVSHATKMDNGTEYMDVVHYQCDTGYTGYTGGQHSVNRTCGANGTWSNGNLTCQIVSCGPSNNVSLATKMDNGTEYMDVVHYQCVTGYTGYTGGQHSVNRTCGANGTWSNENLTCQIVSCGPSSNVSHATKMDNGTEYMDVVHYQCDTGYTGYTGGQHSVNRTCGANGTWSNGNLTCQIVSCGPSNNVSLATKMDNGTEYMDVVHYQCDTGYTGYTGGQHSVNRTCGANGTWSNENLTCQIVSCGPSSNVSHATKMDNGTEYMDVVHYQCDTGYTGYTGGQHFVNRTCGANGTWSNGNLTCQIVSCGPSNNVSLATKMDNGTEYMDVVHYQCDTGYTGYTGGQHSVNRTCGANGTWSNENLTCQIVSCGPSSNVSHATKMDNGTEYMDVVHYQCDTGYTGEQHFVNRTCGANGTWSNGNLTCQIVSCGPSNNVSHATKMVNGTEYMDVVHYQCDTGYTGYTGGQHSVNRTCGANGTWSNGNLTCQIDCAQFENITCVSYGEDSKVCFKFIQGEQTHDQASAACNGSLIIIDSENKDKFFRHYLNECHEGKRQCTHIYGTKQNKEFGLNYTNWKNGEPKDTPFIAYEKGKWKWITIDEKEKCNTICEQR